MGKKLSDRLQDCVAEESTQIEGTTDLDSVNPHKDSRDWSLQGTTNDTNLHKLILQQELVPDVHLETRPSSLPTLKDWVEILREKFDVVLERNKHLEESLANLMREENALEIILNRQTQQISSIDERQVEQERVLLAPMRIIYTQQFHDLVATLKPFFNNPLQILLLKLFLD